VRPFVVEAFDEVVELGLLLEEIAAGRLGGLEFQGEMHAFVAAVLLEVTENCYQFPVSHRGCTPELLPISQEGHK